MVVLSKAVIDVDGVDSDADVTSIEGDADAGAREEPPGGVMRAGDTHRADGEVLASTTFNETTGIPSGRAESQVAIDGDTVQVRPVSIVRVDTPGTIILRTESDAKHSPELALRHGADAVMTRVFVVEDVADIVKAKLTDHMHAHFPDVIMIPRRSVMSWTLGVG